jgi:hypothetical protein
MVAFLLHQSGQILSFCHKRSGILSKSAFPVNRKRLLYILKHALIHHTGYCRHTLNMPDAPVETLPK